MAKSALEKVDEKEKMDPSVNEDFLELCERVDKVILLLKNIIN